MGLTNPPDLEIKDRLIGWGVVFLLALIAGILGLWLGNAEAQLAPAYSDEAIARAIWHAEGGFSAKKPFGILSVPCKDYWECKEVCLNTIKNNRKRFTKQERYDDFLEFMASRYAPKSASNDPKNLNKNWLKNVMYFLEKK